MEQAVFGLIGAGYLANAQHLPNLAVTPHARLKTVCDLNKGAARESVGVNHLADGSIELLTKRFMLRL